MSFPKLAALLLSLPRRAAGQPGRFAATARACLTPEAKLMARIAAQDAELRALESRLASLRDLEKQILSLRAMSAAMRDDMQALLHAGPLTAPSKTPEGEHARKALTAAVGRIMAGIGIAPCAPAAAPGSGAASSGPQPLR